MSKFSNEEKAKEAEREITMRYRVYGRSGDLTPTQEKQIAIMLEIAADYRAAAEAEKLI